MKLKESAIVTTTLNLVFPLVVLFSLYLMAYGGAFPGGGFQGGVLLATGVLILEATQERRVYPEILFLRMESTGVLLLAGLMTVGWVWRAVPFGGLYGAGLAGSLMIGNYLIWILGFAIYLEVAGSMVLIGRRFLPGHEPNRRRPSPSPSPPTKPRNDFALKWTTFVLLLAMGAFVALRVPSLQHVVHRDVESFQDLTRNLGIQNMVTAVYLGPRAVDTLLEVLVVLLSVFGMHAMEAES